MRISFSIEVQRSPKMPKELRNLLASIAEEHEAAHDHTDEYLDKLAHDDEAMPANRAEGEDDENLLADDGYVQPRAPYPAGSIGASLPRKIEVQNGDDLDEKKAKRREAGLKAAATRKANAEAARLEAEREARRAKRAAAKANKQTKLV